MSDYNMPAEKLTKKRVIQLMIALIILLGLFFYKTYQYYR